MEVVFNTNENFDVSFGNSETFVISLFSQQTDITFDNNDSFNVAFDEESTFDCVFDVGNGGGSSADEYHGSYEVTPSNSEQTLQTKDKILLNNVTVHKTPYYEVSNIYGGKTVTIL